jgi:hypothetical protein
MTVDNQINTPAFQVSDKILAYGYKIGLGVGIMTCFRIRWMMPVSNYPFAGIGSQVSIYPCLQSAGTACLHIRCIQFPAIRVQRKKMNVTNIV